MSLLLKKEVNCGVEAEPNKPFAGLFFAVLLLILTGFIGIGEKTDQSGVVTEQDYRRAEALLNRNVQAKVLYSDIRPQWLDDDRFWYRVRTGEGFRFYLVNPETAERDDAFDHDELAESLEEALGRNIRASDLPFSTFRYVKGESAIRFVIDGDRWECDLDQYQCVDPDLPDRPPNSLLSPDRRWAAYIRDHNLWVRDMENGDDIALTEGGEQHYGFATNSQGWFRSDRPVLNWSPDSRKIATYRLDERDVAEMHLLETAEGRPVHESWPYALPGDDKVPMHERVVLDVENRTKVWLDIEPSHQRTSNCCGLERGDRWADIDWRDDASELAFVTTSRDYREVNLYIADTETGSVRHVYREKEEPFFESNLTSRGVPNWRVLFDRKTFLWFSRRDEWGHLYYHRLDDAGRIGRITSGEWNVVDLLHVDEQMGTVFFTAVGKEPERDPYRTHFYKTELPDGNNADSPNEDNAELLDGNSVPVDNSRTGDTPSIDNRTGDTSSDGTTGRHYAISEPLLLTAEDANHEISVSPSGRFFVDEYSGFRSPSVTMLRSSDGSDVMPLEEADITPLEETAWTMPEPFVVKARAGETDLYGLIYKPSDFDSTKSYPVVVNLYPGPQIGSVGTRSFTPVRRGQTHALAELGFIVVQMDALGTPLRSRSFHTHWYGDMSDNGLEDQIAGIRQLGERHDWLDSDRAGIYGHSGGGYATASALLRFPGVFKAGVASAGNMDNRGYTFYWGEKYQGLRNVEEVEGEDPYKSQAIWKKAGQLEDHLLLSYGTMDNNVHPNMTLLLVNELIRENKDFDLLVMPNRNHGYANESYHVRRTWDYFVRHLLKAEPPHEYEFN